MNAKTEEGCILTGVTDHAFIARLEGRLTQRSMWNMKRVVERYGDAGMPDDVVVDVAHCTYMDSTMLGLLARWALACAAAHDARPFLVGLGEGDLATIFRRMSLDRLFQLSDLEAPAARLCGVAPAAEAERSDRARHVLAAHETLAELSPENAAAFALLIGMLKQEAPHGAQEAAHV